MTPSTWRLRGAVWLALTGPALLASSASAQGGVYRCTDASGHVAYQAVPCTGGKQIDTVPAGRAAPAPTTAPAPRTAAAPAAPPPNARNTGRAVEPTQGPQGTQAWGADADVIVVSGYQLSGGVTQVHVNHPARPVLLVLSSHNKTEWKVLPAPGTRIKAIVAASSDGPPLVQPLPQVPVAYDDLPYATETGNVKFRQLISKLNARYGVNKVTGFRGGYQLPAVVPVSGPFAPDPNLSLDGLRPEVPRIQFGFDLVSTDGRRLPWTNTGPKDGKRYTGIVRGGGPFAMRNGGPAAVREDGREAYVLEGNGGTLLWFSQGLSGPSVKVALPPDLPDLSWGSGLAWDTRRNVLAIVSFGGEGHFYRYDTRARKWLGARSLQNRDLHSLALDPGSGRYFSISDRAELVVFNENGELEEVQPLAKVLPDLDSTYDRGNERMQGLAVAAGNGAVAILNIRDASVTHIWTYELGSRKGQLTYKMVD